MPLIHAQYISGSYKPNLEHLSFLVDTAGGVCVQQKVWVLKD